MRFAEKGDFPAVRALWETCFPDEGGFNDYFFQAEMGRQFADSGYNFYAVDLRRYGRRGFFIYSQSGPSAIVGCE